MTRSQGVRLTRLTRAPGRVGATAVALLALGLAGPTYADPGGNFPGPATPTPTPTPTTTGGTVYDQVGNCSVVSTPGYMGLSCSGGSGKFDSIAKTLHGDDLPTCWNDAMTPAQQDAMMLGSKEGESWYWERCLHGIDPDTLEVGPDGVTFTITYVSLTPDQVTTLTPHQLNLVDRFDQDGQIPSPVAGVSPMDQPRVGAWFSFFDGTDDEVTVRAGGVVLRARIERLTVEPLGEGVAEPSDVALPLHCDGTGHRAERGDNPDNADGCWFKYLRSSADQSDNDYDVWMTAHWKVEYSLNGADFQPFNEFDKSQITTIPVSEIEALVVR